MKQYDVTKEDYVDTIWHCDGTVELLYVTMHYCDSTIDQYDITRSIVMMKQCGTLME